MTKPRQPPRAVASAVHQLESMLSKESGKRAIELAFLARLLHGAPADATAAKVGKAGSAEARDIEDQVKRDLSAFRNPFFAGLARALERLQGGDVAFGPFKGAKALLAVEGAQLQESRPSSFIENMIQRGDLLDPATFAARSGWTQQKLTKESRANRVFFIELESPRCFPAFYADGKYDLRHLATVTKDLGDLPGPAKLLLFIRGKGSLAGLNPLEAIGRWQLAKVRDIAEAYRDA